ncbi:hypothetical protein HID58_048682 [Brassica napus]|uniref:Uncharacterized protein n=1 Tax=Brassica napus TaxID=3708 RepID=A0ABQ8B2U1_BRANA|nr:uncharacterized protein LOC106379662 [Brassica napus]KAH0899114.1 hypothetical protein HID58_048682 [Brassica napus]
MLQRYVRIFLSEETMEEKKPNLDAPFLSVRRIPTKLENPIDSENTKKKTTTTRRRKVKDSCQETEHGTMVRLLQDDKSFDHVMEPSLVPPGKPKDHHTLLQESDLIKALDMVSSTASFSVNCSTNGVSDEFENNGGRPSSVSKDDVNLEYRDLIMARFLPAAKAIALKQKKGSFRDQEEKMMKKKKKKRIIALQRVSMAINQDLNNDDYGHDHVEEAVHSSEPKKAMFGFLPQLCSKNSLDVLNPVLFRIKTCQNVAVSSSKIINPKTQDSVYKTKPASSTIIVRSNKAMSKSQETCPIPRFSEKLSTTSRLQRTSSTQIKRQDARFLSEGVKRTRNRNKNRSGNISVSQPPLPKTPSESWLCRTLPRSSTVSTVVPGQLPVLLSGQDTGLRKMMDQKSIKWETIVKTSYKHHDNVRYSEELTVVHPSRQHKP